MNSSPDRQQGTVYVASRLVAEGGTMFAPGAVAIADGCVLLAGQRADVLRAVPAGFTRLEFPGAAIVPGLVNAHAHLQIPRIADPLGNVLPVPASFTDWILRVIAWKRGSEPSAFAGYFGAASREALSFGTTAVGEIAGPDIAAYAASPLRARVFAEGIGFSPDTAPEVLAGLAGGVCGVEGSPRLSPPRGVPRGDVVPRGRRRGDLCPFVPGGGKGRILVPRHRPRAPRVPAARRPAAGGIASRAQRPPSPTGDRRAARGGSPLRAVPPQQRGARERGAGRYVLRRRRDPLLPGDRQPGVRPGPFPVGGNAHGRIPLQRGEGGRRLVQGV